MLRLTLRHEQNLACGLSTFQIAMRLLHFFQFVNMGNSQLQLARPNHGEDVSGSLLQFLACAHVMNQAWPR